MIPALLLNTRAPSGLTNIVTPSARTLPDDRADKLLYAVESRFLRRPTAGAPSIRMVDARSGQSLQSRLAKRVSIPPEPTMLPSAASGAADPAPWNTPA